MKKSLEVCQGIAREGPSLDREFHEQAPASFPAYVPFFRTALIKASTFSIGVPA
jgi:hypothetical protein